MDGIIVVNKEKGYTSHDIVAIIRKELQIKKVGHTGTLDPNATGVLPILLGEGTKLSQYLTDHDKEYEAILELGTQTDTGDVEGKVINQDLNIKEFDKIKILQVLQSCIGEMEQLPPMYSAIKVKGKKLYEYAREGKKVEIPVRKIKIYDIQLLEYSKNLIKFHVSCSKGTYIRTLCEEIAHRLGTIGYMKELKRTKVGKFTLQDSIKIEEIGIKNSQMHIISLQEFFKNKDNIYLTQKQLKPFYNGVKITINNMQHKFTQSSQNDNIVNVYYNQTWLGIAKLLKDESIYKIKREIIIKSINEIC